MDDLIGADLLVLGPKAVVIPSYTPRVCYNQQTVRCIHTVSVSIHLYSILLFFVQCWTIKNFKDRYVPSRTEWPHRRLRTPACFVKPIKTKLKPILIILPRRLRKNNSSASTLPSEIERHFESKIFTQGLSMYFNLVRARTMWKLSTAEMLRPWLNLIASHFMCAMKGDWYFLGRCTCAREKQNPVNEINSRSDRNSPRRRYLRKKDVAITWNMREPCLWLFHIQFKYMCYVIEALSHSKLLTNFYD